jgi:hypothetical protein
MLNSHTPAFTVLRIEKRDFTVSPLGEWVVVLNYHRESALVIDGADDAWK